MWYKYIAALGVLCLCVTTAQAAGFSGEYQGVISNQSMHLSLHDDNNAITGRMTASSGDYYEINCKHYASSALCAGIHSGDYRSSFFQFSLDPQGLIWTPTQIGTPEQNAILARAATRFTRIESSSTAPATADTNSATNNTATGQLDARLFGNWVHTNIYVSGTTSAASEKYVQFNTNGTFTHQNGRFVGGGDSGSFDSGGGSPATHGRWQTQDSNLYYLVDGESNWVNYGHYGFSSDRRTMRIVFANGNKELWERR